MNEAPQSANAQPEQSTNVRLWLSLALLTLVLAAVAWTIVALLARQVLG
jgi:hypothetical protein